MEKKYYWLKLKEDFFDDDTIKWIEEQDNGKEYCLFYLKLCLKAIKKEGSIIRIVGNSLIPYDMEGIAEITNTNIDTVMIAMEIFKKIGLIEIYDNGEIYMSQLNTMLGSETKWANYKRKQRLSKDKTVMIGQCPKNVHTEIEKEIEKEVDVEECKNQTPPATTSDNIADLFPNLKPQLKQTLPPKDKEPAKTIYRIIRLCGYKENNYTYNEFEKMVNTYGLEEFKNVANKFFAWYAERDPDLSFNAINKMWQWLADEQYRITPKTILKNKGETNV